jgi:hypothetical protein
VALYPAFHEYFRASAPPLLAVWGRHDPFFLPAGAEAFKRDLPGADVRFLPTGHFALETHATEIASAIIDFLLGGGQRRDRGHPRVRQSALPQVGDEAPDQGVVRRRDDHDDVAQRGRVKRPDGHVRPRRERGDRHDRETGRSSSSPRRWRARWWTTGKAGRS